MSYLIVAIIKVSTVVKLDLIMVNYLIGIQNIGFRSQLSIKMLNLF